MKTLIIFDVGGVLVTLNTRAMFDAFAQHSDLAVDQIMRRFAELGVEKKLHTGDTPGYYDGVREATKSNMADEQIAQFRLLVIPEQIDEMVQIKRRLHNAGYAIGILSTTSAIEHPYLQKRWPEMFESYGGPQELSYKEGRIKPDPEVYARFKADRIVFIDDKSAYLKHPVEELGWIGIQFTPYRDLDEPIRHTGSNHGDIEIAHKNFYVANSPQDVERILQART
jgi:FMN phosphatase YigB (HAD superfamily)